MSKYPIKCGEEVMSKKGDGANGTLAQPLQTGLRYGVDEAKAKQIVAFNRHYAENSGYFLTTAWKDTVPKDGSPTTYYDPADGKPLFRAPIGRSWDDFLKESIAHGWPSFRDAEVVWENVRTLEDGETVSLVGSHLGHNLPDGSGNRYCINLVSCAGNPAE